MPGVKGKTNNPNGRPKGFTNKMAEEMRMNVLDFLVVEFPALQANMKKLAPNEFVRAYIDLMKYGIYPAQAPEKTIDEKSNDDIRDKIIAASKE